MIATRYKTTILAQFAGLILAWATCGAQAQMPSPVVDGERIASPQLVESACSEGAVTYYTAQSDGDERAIIEPFEKQFGCIKVSVISAVTGRLFERVATEALANKVQADVILITDVALAQEMINRKWVRLWSSPLGDKYPANAKHEGWWYAASGSLMYPIYNTQLVQAKDLPQTWADLLDPRWRGKIATSPITIGGTAWVQYDFMATQLGADYLKQFAAQMPKLFPSYDPAVLSVARGETVLGIVSALNEYSARTHQGAPVMPLYLPEGTPYTDYPMMLTANAPHPNAGELFANWYLSKTAQTQLVNIRGAYSVRDDVAPAQGNPALADTKPWNPGDAAIVRDHDALVKKVSEMLGR